jgi:hypothetical protein
VGHCKNYALEKNMAACENLYANGYVYVDGDLALGSPCVAPTILLRNRMASPIIVFYESRTPLGTQLLVNRLVIDAKGFALVAGLLPSVGKLLSLIRLEDEDGNTRSFALHHHPTEGYSMEVVGGVAPISLSLVGAVVPQQISCVAELAHGLIMTLAIRSIAGTR